MIFSIPESVTEEVLTRYLLITTFKFTVNSRYIEVQGTYIFLRYNRVFVIRG